MTLLEEEIQDITENIEQDERWLDRVIIKLRLRLRTTSAQQTGLPPPSLVGNMPMIIHETWFESNPSWREACVGTLKNDPLAPCPTWPVYYKGVTWLPLPHGTVDQFEVNGQRVRPHLRLVVLPKESESV